jgi:hypothetical protein
MEGADIGVLNGVGSRDGSLVPGVGGVPPTLGKDLLGAGVNAAGVLGDKLLAARLFSAHHEEGAGKGGGGKQEKGYLEGRSPGRRRTVAHNAKPGILIYPAHIRQAAARCLPPMAMMTTR